MGYLFEESEIPYTILEKYGLTQEMIEDLPVQVINDILSGGVSPKLPITCEGEDGNNYSVESRFALYQREDGTIDVRFFYKPVNVTENMVEGSERDQLERTGFAKGFIKNDPSTEYYLQKETDTGLIWMSPVTLVDRNIESYVRNQGLMDSEMEKLKSGQLVSYYSNDSNEVTIGLDLRQTDSLRAVLGDSEKWNREGEYQWDKYNFGVYGCWMKDDAGHLQYISEENYTDELWGIQAQHNATPSSAQREEDKMKRTGRSI